MQQANQENELRMTLDRQRRNAGESSLKDEIGNWVPTTGVKYIKRDNVRNIQGYYRSHRYRFSRKYPLAGMAFTLYYYRANDRVKEVNKNA